MIAMLMVLPPSASAHWDSAYFRNAEDGFSNRSTWMAEIRDDVSLSELALPGTHNSASYTQALESVATQTLDFQQQLDAGLRVFDIRIRHTSNAFALHHGAFYLDQMFGDFLDSVTGFLKSNPSETVLFRLKVDHAAADDNTQTLVETLDDYLAKAGSTYLRTVDPNIPLGDARGKFVILSNVSEFNSHGLSYASFNIQDEFSLSTNWDLYDKWLKVKQQLAVAVAGDKNEVYVNYLSGSGGAFPYFVASGHSSPGTSAPRLATGLTTPLFDSSYPDFPRVSCFIGICTIAFEGTNTLTRDKVAEYNAGVPTGGSTPGRSVGIIMADYPGDGLIEEIINNNAALRRRGTALDVSPAAIQRMDEAGLRALEERLRAQEN